MAAATSPGQRPKNRRQHEHEFKAISDLAACDGFTGEKATEINEKFDTNFPAAHRN